ncbi:hypothetical protein JR316_0002135 [Psilocybe cubensis]|uniref:BTB domain-containing protein n=2 Tax=Psilocybe cubensis TaxID=181762 RepID=A0A8H7Y7D8_PSICU|nr:hypothetical protein JR316_0002135 [Psilocybe cubensis]KAH9485228.1 hypothetical protein JR316_0002135 [Psilocybe cubensis]
MTSRKIEQPLAPGLHFIGPKKHPKWVEPPYRTRQFEGDRRRYNHLLHGIDPDVHTLPKAEKRKREAFDDGDDESTQGGHDRPPFKKIHKTRSYHIKRRADCSSLSRGKKHHSYDKDYRFYLKGGDVYFVIDNTIFCVHKKKLITSGGYLADVLDTNLLFHEETIRDRPVLHLDTLGITVRQFRFFLSFIYGTIIILRTLPSGKPLLYFEAALEVLVASVKLDHQSGREAALEGLETLFPSKGKPVPFKPTIAGCRSNDEERLFYRTFPLQALPVLEECCVPAMLPMAYYHVALLPHEDIVNGVHTIDGKLLKLGANYIDVILKAQKTLKSIRNKVLFKWLYDLVEGDKKLGPRKATLKCANQNMRGNIPCFPFLVRMLELSNANGYTQGTNCLEGFHDKAKEIIGEHLCYICLEYVLEQANLCLEESWERLPRCFGLPPWEKLQKWQQTFAEGFAGNYT